MGQQKVIIMGAGKIGRGFIADIYKESGYLPVFVDVSKELISKMKQQQKYTLLKTSPDGIVECVIRDFQCFELAEKSQLLELACDVDVVFIAVFSETYGVAAEFICDFIAERLTNGNTNPLNLVICANEMDTAGKLAELVQNQAAKQPAAVLDYINKKTGFVDTLAIRMSVDPPEEYRRKDELAVLTNGYPSLFYDKKAWRGKLPEETGMVGIDDIKAGEDRKLFTYNLVHAILAYWGKQKGFTTVADSIGDEEILKIVLGALDEISSALQLEYGFTSEEMEAWNTNLIEDMKNPYLKDSVDRVGGNPVRKLSRTDRMTGPALLCRKHGILPYFISTAIAKVFRFVNIQDNSAIEIQEYLSTEGIRKAVKKFCNLEYSESDFTDLIVSLYENDDKAIDWKKIPILKSAYNKGFTYEKKYKGCAQCLLQSLFSLSGAVNKSLYQSASGLSGGTAITGDGSCGGYIGSVLFMGQYAGRRFDFLSDGDKDEQYKSYEMAQQFHDRFERAYGSILCSDVHKKLFGQSFNLRTPDVREEFEAAGAHIDKCTTVIANSAMWAAELLIDSGFWDIDEINNIINISEEGK